MKQLVTCSGATMESDGMCRYSFMKKADGSDPIRREWLVITDKTGSYTVGNDYTMVFEVQKKEEK